MKNTKAPDHCSTLYGRATRCYDEHYARWGDVIGTPLYARVRNHVSRSSSTCFTLALQHARECGGGVSIGPRRRR